MFYILHRNIHLHAAYELKRYMASMWGHKIRSLNLSVFVSIVYAPFSISFPSKWDETDDGNWATIILLLVLTPQIMCALPEMAMSRTLCMYGLSTFCSQRIHSRMWVKAPNFWFGTSVTVKCAEVATFCWLFLFPFDISAQTDVAEQKFGVQLTDGFLSAILFGCIDFRQANK